MNRLLRFSLAGLTLLALALPAQAATDRPLRSVVANLGPDPGPATGVTFIVDGDNRGTAKGAPLPRVLRTIFDEIALVRPDLVLWSGDTVFGYCDSEAELEGEFNAFLAVAARGGVPVFNVPGNHEIHAGQTCAPAPAIPASEPCGPPCSESVFERRMSPLYGSFDFAGLHFIGLDTDDPNAKDTIAGRQLEWLKADLEANKTARGIFVFTHTQFFSSPTIDPARKHGSIKNGTELHAIFKAYPVKAVFSGHEHLFWHEEAAKHDGIDYFTAGGAGAPLYATPQGGGFSHYVVVRVPAQGDAAYEVIEPGRIYVEPAAGTATEARFWLIDSAYTLKPLDLAGAETDVPASLGGCGELAASSDFRTREGKAVALSVMSCTPGPLVNHLRIKAEGVPAGASILVAVKKK